MEKGPIESSFDFPNEDDRFLLKKVRSYKRLRQVLLELKYSPQYKDKNIVYSIRRWGKSKSKTLTNLSVYFSCCKVTCRPSIHFSSQDGSNYVFQNRSTFTHYHFKKKIARRAQSFKKTALDQDEMCEKVQIKKRHKKRQCQDMIEEVNVQQLMQEESEPSEKSDSWQIKEYMQSKIASISIMKKKMFDFPTLDLLQKIKTIPSMSVLTNKFNHQIRVKCLEYFGIRYEKRTFEKMDENGEQVKAMTVRFTCCTTKTQIPYLTYIQKEPGMFHLQDYYIQHDHKYKNKTGRPKKVDNQLKQIDIVDDQQLSLTPKGDASEDMFLNFVSPQQQQLVDQYEQNDEMGEQSKHQHFKEQFFEEASYYEEENKQSLKPIQQALHPSQSIQQPSQAQWNLSQTILKTTENVKENIVPPIQESSNWVQAFTKKQKQSSIVMIQISSQSQNQIENSIGKYIHHPQNCKNLPNQTSNKSPIFSIAKNEPHKRMSIISKYYTQQLKTSTPSLIRASIYYWFSIYNQQIFKFILQKHWNNRYLCCTFPSLILKSFQQHFPNFHKHQQKIQLLWNQCIFYTLENNKINTLQISSLNGEKHIGFHFDYQWKVYVKSDNYQKFSSINKIKNGKQEEIEIYLAAYPIRIAKRLAQTKLFIAYTLTSELHPNLLWFYFFKDFSKQVIQNFLEEDQQPNAIYQVLKYTILSFQFKKVKFIYTTLDYQLLTALDKICTHTTTDLQFKISSTIHFACIDDLFKTEGLLTNSQLGNEVENRIKRSSKCSDVKNSCKILKNFFNKLSNSKTDESERLINPRIIYEHYLTFAEPFSANYNRQEFISSDMSFFSSSLLYDEKERIAIEDPVQELNRIFFHYNGFNHIAEAFIFMIRFFDSDSRNVVAKAYESQIVPNQCYQIQKQFMDFKRICTMNPMLLYSLEKLFSESAYEMSLIFSNCSGFIKQTIYRMIIVANELALKNPEKQISQKQDSKLYIDHDMSHNEQMYYVKFLRKQEDRVGNRLCSQKKKKWLCSCNFYNRTGIPCQHEILAALENKDSLFDEVHSHHKIQRN